MCQPKLVSPNNTRFTLVHLFLHANGLVELVALTETFVDNCSCEPLMWGYFLVSCLDRAARSGGGIALLANAGVAGCAIRTGDT